MYKINNNIWYGDLNLIRTRSVHKYNRLDSCNYFVSSNNVFVRSIYKLGPKVWRKITKEFKLMNFNLIKKHLRKHFLSFYNL